MLWEGEAGREQSIYKASSQIKQSFWSVASVQIEKSFIPTHREAIEYGDELRSSNKA